jgi:phytoene synthase
MRDASRCEEIVRRHARTFALASRMLPREKRRGVFAAYAFCRTADDIVDLAAGEDALTRLRTYREALTRALNGADDHPVLREVAWAVRRFGVPVSALDTLLGGVEQDLVTTRYDTWNELQRYCQGVASSVGEMCTAVFGVADNAHGDRARSYARTLGVAMQLTNILRDIGEDARHGRCYLPLEDLERFGLSRADVLAQRVDARSPSWRLLMAFEIARARDLYRDALPGIALLAPDAQRCALACAAGYAAILRAIERNGCDTFSRRAVVAPALRARILVQSWLRLPPHVPAGPERSPGRMARQATA